MPRDVRRGRLNTDPPAPVATGQTVRLAPHGETAGFHCTVSPRLEVQRVNRCRGDTRGVIARGIIAECGTECLIRGRVALLWSLRKSSGLRLVWRGGAASESAKKQGTSSFSFLPATPCRQSGFCSVVKYDVTERTGVCPLAPVLRGGKKIGRKSGDTACRRRKSFPIRSTKSLGTGVRFRLMIILENQCPHGIHSHGAHWFRTSFDCPVPIPILYRISSDGILGAISNCLAISMATCSQI